MRYDCFRNLGLCRAKKCTNSLHKSSTDLFGGLYKATQLHSWTHTVPAAINNGAVPRWGRRQQCRSITYRWTLAQEIEQRTRKNRLYSKGQWSSSFCHFCEIIPCSPPRPCAPGSSSAELNLPSFALVVMCFILKLYEYLGLTEPLRAS